MDCFACARSGGWLRAVAFVIVWVKDNDVTSHNASDCCLGIERDVDAFTVFMLF